MKTSAPQPYTVSSVMSKDGTTIGYRQMGHGPGVILVHGGMQASQNFMKLAGALSDEFTVYVPDRRGRGLSGPHGDHYSLAKEGEDMRALVDKTGAQNIFGLSSGAIVVLQAALTVPSLRKVAVYEPPIPINGSSPDGWVTRYDQEIAQGKLAAAMVSVLKGTMDTSFFSSLPRFILVPLLTQGIKADTQEVNGDDVPIQVLIPTMHYDAQLVGETRGKHTVFKAIGADVLLLGGSKSQGYLKTALDALNTLFPNAKRVEFSGVGHLAADNGGQPERVAEELRRFFSAAQKAAS